MTDKQIIIDVSKCKECGLRNCEGTLIYWCHTYDDHCQDFDNCYYKQLKRKEQECEELKAKFQDMKKSRDIALKEYNEEFEYKRQITVEHLEQKKELLKQLDQLKAEVKSKTEYIQEQRDIINQYSKEIEMYKKCQGKRASKREEELKAENKHLNDLLNQALKELEKTRETLTEIKEIAEEWEGAESAYMVSSLILQKISEVEE